MDIYIYSVYSFFLKKKNCVGSRGPFSDSLSAKNFTVCFEFTYSLPFNEYLPHLAV